MGIRVLENELVILNMLFFPHYWDGRLINKYTFIGVLKSPPAKEGLRVCNPVLLHCRWRICDLKRTPQWGYPETTHKDAQVEGENIGKPSISVRKKTPLKDNFDQIWWIAKACIPQRVGCKIRFCLLLAMFFSCAGGATIFPTSLKTSLKNALILNHFVNGSTELILPLPSLEGSRPPDHGETAWAAA